MTEKLDNAESKELDLCEEVIAKGQTAFIEVGNALATIRESRLYREKFETFQEYCEKRWEFTRARAYQLMGAVEVVKSLPPKMSTRVDTEAKARALRAVPEPKRKEVLKAASKTAKKEKRHVTVKDIKAAAKPPKKRSSSSSSVDRMPRGGLAAAAMRAKNTQDTPAKENDPAPSAKIPDDGKCTWELARQRIQELYESNKSKWNQVPPPAPILIIKAVLEVLK